MIRLALDAPSVARIRFAASPAQELLQWLLRAVRDDPHPHYGRPGPTARAALAHPSLRLLTELAQGIVTGNYAPDFLTPSPSLPSGCSGVAEQIERVGATAAPVAAAQLTVLYGQAPAMPPLVREAIDQGSVAAQAAEGMGAFWAASLADGWGDIQRMVDRDIARRAALWSQVGIGGMLASLHPDVGWASGEIRIGSAAHQVQTMVKDMDVVLAPSVLGDCRMWTQTCSAADVWLSYPISAEVSGPAHAASAALLGSSRAAIVDLLTVRRTTRELAVLLGLSPADVSYHLHVLHRAGMIIRERSGRSVYYQISA